MRVLGINALFHDPAAALVVDGRAVAAIEEERLSRRKHGHRPVPFAAWELPELAARWCLESQGLGVDDLDAVTYSYDPRLAEPAPDLGLDDPWDGLRQEYARRAASFLTAALPGLDQGQVRHVPHHVSHAASAALAAPGAPDTDVLVLDGRGECASHLAGRYDGGRLTLRHAQRLPHSLGLLYESLTEHLGFLRSSDEFKVMALASYGSPRHLGTLRERVRVSGPGFATDPIDWSALAPRLEPGGELTDAHADLACSVQRRLEEVLLDLARDLRAWSGNRRLALAGGVALNCVANTVLHERSGYEHVWVQPAAGDAGTALGSALQASADGGVPIADFPGMTSAALGPGWSDEDIEGILWTAHVPYQSPADLAGAVARCLADDGVVAWFQGRSEFGPRALGQRSLLAHPGHHHNLERLNDVKGREQFRPVAPMVRASRAPSIVGRGPLPSPHMLFVHDIRPEWRERIPAVVHVDGTARLQTVDDAEHPLLGSLLERFERLTGLPVLVNTSLNTAGRPMVDHPREALELFGSAPVDLLVLGPFTVHRSHSFHEARADELGTRVPA